VWYLVALGVIQGFFEWLPVSSKSMLMLFSSIFLGYATQLSYAIAMALQGGTVVSASMYFYRDLLDVLRPRYRYMLKFLVVTTAVTGAVGVPLYIYVEKVLVRKLDLGGSAFLIGLLLLMQILFRKTVKSYRVRDIDDINLIDSIIFGCIQALSVFPGISRSGITITALLYLGYRVEDALKLSFIASIPANIGATIITFILCGEALDIIPIESLAIALATSAIIGIATIDILMKLASKHSIPTTLSIAIISIVLGIAYSYYSI